jgi:protease-4
VLLYPFRYLAWLIARLRRATGRPPEFVVFVLEAPLPALPDPPPQLWQRLLGRRSRLSVKELGERFDAIARDSRVRGVILHLRATPASMASLQDLRELVTRLRSAGKRVVAWAPTYRTGTYYLACACDEILLMPTGSVQPLGFSSTAVFLADGLARFGLSADFVQISPYKSAADPLMRSQMSDEFRQQTTWLLESNFGEVVAAIADGRRLDASAAKALIDGSPYGDDVAVKKRVVDAIVGEEDLARHLAGGGGRPATVGTWERATRKLPVPAPRLRRGRYVALVRIEGTIIDGRSGRLPVQPPLEVPLIGEERAGDLSVVQIVRQATLDKRAAAVVLYVNSRGGSSTASEAMRQALEKLAARKPVVVVMGPVAASGGYWISTPGSWIVARPGTLTGSIGVLSGKLVTGALWRRLLFNRETIALGERATLESDEARFSDEERAIVRGDIVRIYEAFLERVARSRGMTVTDVDAIAQGKVWTGRQALGNKLVDEMGGLDAGAAKARSLARLPADAHVREVRGPRRVIAPFADVRPAMAWLGYLVEGARLIRAAPALAVMDYYAPGDVD